MAFWGNLLGYQATWFAVAWSAGRGQAWIGILACACFVAWQLAASSRRGADIRVLFAALACGALVDGAIASLGLLTYASPAPGLPAPAWIVALWGAFALTLNHSMAWFAHRPSTTALFAAIGGPMAYLGAARGFGALVFPDPAWPALIALSVAWAIALPMLLRIAAGPQRAHIAPTEAVA